MNTKYVFLDEYTHTCTNALYVHVYMYTCMHVCTSTCLHTCICMYTVHIHVHVCAHLKHMHVIHTHEIVHLYIFYLFSLRLIFHLILLSVHTCSIRLSISLQSEEDLRSSSVRKDSTRVFSDGRKEVNGMWFNCLQIYITIDN